MTAAACAKELDGIPKARVVDVPMAKEALAEKGKENVDSSPPERSDIYIKQGGPCSLAPIISLLVESIRSATLLLGVGM